MREDENEICVLTWQGVLEPQYRNAFDRWLRAQRHHRACEFVATGDRRNLLVLSVGDDIKQLFDTAASNGRDDAKLSAMSPDRINHRGLLSDKQMPRAMKYQTTLLFRCLGRHKPHVGPADRLAYRLGISGIVLLSFDVGLHIGGRHQTHIVSQCLKLACPMVR